MKLSDMDKTSGGLNCVNVDIIKEKCPFSVKKSTLKTNKPENQPTDALGGGLR